MWNLVLIRNSTKLGLARLLRLLHARLARLDDERRPCLNWCSPPAYVLDDAEIALPGFRRDRAADVAALAVEEADGRVPRRDCLPIVELVDAVAVAGDRRAHELGRDDRRVGLAVVDAELVHPVGVGIARE